MGIIGLAIKVILCVLVLIVMSILLIGALTWHAIDPNPLNLILSIVAGILLFTYLIFSKYYLLGVFIGGLSC